MKVNEMYHKSQVNFSKKREIDRIMSQVYAIMCSESLWFQRFKFNLWAPNQSFREVSYYIFLRSMNTDVQ